MRVHSHLLTIARARLLPLAIATGPGRRSGFSLYLLDALPLRNVPDASTQQVLGLVLALGSAAVTGAEGIVALAVAAAVAQSRIER